MTLVLVRVLVDWLEHDGIRRKPDDVLELDDVAAERLIGAGLVSDDMLPEPVEIEMPVEEMWAAPEPPAMPKAGRRGR